jgi:large subunit ribosomal protein L22
MTNEQVKAVTKYIRISPRKARLAAGLIRGLPVPHARTQLTFSPLKASRLLIKTLNSAVANAEMRLDVSAENLRIVDVRVDGGPTLKRSKPKNRGGRHAILKRSSHFTVVVGR